MPKKTGSNGIKDFIVDVSDKSNNRYFVLHPFKYGGQRVTKVHKALAKALIRAGAIVTG